VTAPAIPLRGIAHDSAYLASSSSRFPAPCSPSATRTEVR
jgi:hypothetical protein